MIVLALELSSPVGSIAVRCGGTMEASATFPNDRKDSGAFFEELRKHSARLDARSTIVVGLGPGSYAGCRIAVSAALGLSLGTGAALLGYPSICAMAVGEYGVLADARRNSFMFAVVKEHALSRGPELLETGEVTELLAHESVRPLFCPAPVPGFAAAELRHPQASLLAGLVGRADLEFARPPLEPIYLRPPHITAPRPINP